MQCTLVLNLFFPEIAAVVIVFNELVRLRIIFVVVDSIHNTAQAIGTRTHQPVEALPVKWRLNLLCIGIADGRNRICIYDAALQVVGIAVRLQLVRCKIVHRKSGDIPHRLYIPHTLELEVVDRDNGLHIAEKIALMELVLEQYRNQTGLPVMTVYNIRTESDQRKCRKRSLGEECKLLDILIDISVRLRSCKIIFIVNEIKLYTVILHFQHSDVLGTPGKIHIEMSHIIHLALPLFTHTEILWKNYPNIILLFIEILRKGAYYIGQPSCLDKWHTF